MDAALAGLVGAGIGVVGGMLPALLNHTLDRRRLHSELTRANQEAADAARWQRATAYRRLIAAASSMDHLVVDEHRIPLVGELQQAVADVVVFGSPAARQLLRGQGWLANWTSAYGEDDVATLKQSVLAPLLQVVDQEFGETN